MPDRLEARRIRSVPYTLIDGPVDGIPIRHRDEGLGEFDRPSPVDVHIRAAGAKAAGPIALSRYLCRVIPSVIADYQPFLTASLQNHPFAAIKAEDAFTICLLSDLVELCKSRSVESALPVPIQQALINAFNLLWSLPPGILDDIHFAQTIRQIYQIYDQDDIGFRRNDEKLVVVWYCTARNTRDQAECDCFPCTSARVWHAPGAEYRRLLQVILRN